MKQLSAATLVQLAASTSIQMKVKDNNTLAQVPSDIAANLPPLGDHCATPVSSLLSTSEPVPPTEKWVCEVLRNSFEEKWAQCVDFSTTKMEELGVYENSKTYGDTYNHHYDMVGADAQTQMKKIDHIRLWFAYFCKENEVSELA